MAKETDMPKDEGLQGNEKIEEAILELQKELTPELLRLFIEKIVVHEKEAKWSKHAPQTVEIYYNGIGYVGSGQQDVEETMEAPEPLQTQETEEPRQAS